MSAAVFSPVEAVGSGYDNTSITMPESLQSSGLVSIVISGVVGSQGGMLLAVVLGTLWAMFLLAAHVSPKVDDGEPTMVKPRVPLIGHIYGVIVGQTGYLLGLFRKSKLPASTLPMANRKMYALFTSELIQSGLKNKHLSAEPFNKDAAGKLCNLDAASQHRLLNPKGDKSVFHVLRAAMQPSMQGDGLNLLGIAVLRELAVHVNAFDVDPVHGLAVPNLHLWIRSWLSPIHSRALYGKHDPYEGRQDLHDDFWVFEDATAALITAPYPRFTQPRAWKCRERVQAATVSYYAAKHDQDPSVAAFIRARAAGLREAGLTDEDIGRVEFLQFGAATGNSIATLMWFTIHVFSDPAIVDRLRCELLPLLQQTPSGQAPREVTLNIAAVEERCPFLLACFKEVLRVVNVQTSVRRVLEDTYVMDGHSGAQYLLKKGEDVVMPHAVAHRYDSNAWGAEEEALVFRPENFLPSPSDRAKGLDKARRAAWVPFGGGPGLCPGRRIVLVEELAFMSSLVLGFEVEALDGTGRVKLPEEMPMGLGHAIVRPAENAQLGARLKRRAGWEDVVWKYELGKEIKQDL